MTSRKALALAVAGVTITAVVLLASFIRAGEVNINWGPPEGDAPVSGYKVYVGTSPGTYDVVQGQDAGDVLVTSVTTLPDGCVQLHAAVTAYNIAGESPFSDEVAFYVRPVVDSVDESPNPALLLIEGNNYSPGVTMLVNGNPASGMVRDSCTTISVPAVEVPTSSTGQWATLTICNGTVCANYILKPSTKPTGVGVS